MHSYVLVMATMCLAACGRLGYGPAIVGDAGPGAYDGSLTADETGVLQDGLLPEGQVDAQHDGRRPFDPSDAPKLTAGCADGHRDGFLDRGVHPDIAACSGGFAIPGLGDPAIACDHGAGNDGNNPSGVGCSAADLCARGWRVCRNNLEVAERSFGGCTNAAPPGRDESVFFATGQPGPGIAICSDFGNNDIFGCGNVGLPVDASCAPLNRNSGDRCLALPPVWNCPNDKSLDERLFVTKSGAGGGGVLCCRDR